METLSPPPSSGRVIFLEGLIFGVSLGIAHSILYFLTMFLLAPYSLSTLGLLLIVLLWLGVFFWAGVRGAKQTGRVGIGVLAGLMTAVFAGVIAFIALIVYASINAPVLGQQLSDFYGSRGMSVSTNTTNAIFIAYTIFGIVIWLLGIGMGAAMGALGGLLGRSQSTVVPPPPAYSGYPSPPPYGYGQPPMQPPYPPPYPPPYQNQPPQSPDQPYK
jgi:hypothetical protein